MRQPTSGRTHDPHDDDTPHRHAEASPPVTASALGGSSLQVIKHALDSAQLGSSEALTVFDELATRWFHQYFAARGVPGADAGSLVRVARKRVLDAHRGLRAAELTRYLTSIARRVLRHRSTTHPPSTIRASAELADVNEADDPSHDRPHGLDPQGTEHPAWDDGSRHEEEHRSDA